MSEQPILAAIWRTAATNIVGVLVILIRNNVGVEEIFRHL